ncbi:MAG: tRNA (N(6)-L-threonylcarbamoyladenosine(37)-C(2))-methylthiotransferase MtaB [Pseudomonadota bacterium]
MREPSVLTFGCRLNAYESEVIEAHALAAGERDTVYVNTCAVTAEAERQARQAIRRLRRERPGARIVVTGCAAQISPEVYARMPEVTRVLGNAEKLRPESYGVENAERVAVNDILSVRETAGHLVEGLEGRARAFLQVQNGCDHRCTFCIIPFGRGHSRSVPLGALVASAQKLVANGYREIALTGVDLTAYGADLPGKPTLGATLRRLFKLVPELPRLRLSSIDPAEADEELMALLADEPRLMPHLHLSLQSGNNLVLKRMKRRHSREDAVRFCERARGLRKDIVFGADLIAGFPTETDAMFEDTLCLVPECGLTYLHVFPYSARAKTPAARMPQLPVAVRKARAARLREAGAAARQHFFEACVGKDADLLIERPLLGRSAQYAPVRLDREARPGAIVSARIVGAEGDALQGRLSG